jgi:hypothetical protein
MKSLKVGVCFCIAASVFCADSIPAWADGCGDLRAQIAQVQSDAAQAAVEQNRVAAMTPFPQTDATMCAAEVKLIGHVRPLLDEPFGTCFDAQQTATINDALNQIYQGANAAAGQMHCAL